MSSARSPGRAHEDDAFTLGGLVLLAALLAYAFVLPLIQHGDPLQQDLLQMLQTPNRSHLLGFDHLGRDMLTRLSAALRLSLGLAALCVISALIAGVFTGVISALYGGWPERLLSIVGDMCLALPGLLLVLLLAAIAPDAPQMLWLGISLVLWWNFSASRVPRCGQLCRRPVCRPANCSGSLPVSFRHHLWPALAPVLLTLTLFSFSSAIMAVSALGFISVGVRPPTPELGLMMTELLPFAWKRRGC